MFCSLTWAKWLTLTIDFTKICILYLKRRHNYLYLLGSTCRVASNKNSRSKLIFYVVFISVKFDIFPFHFKDNSLSGTKSDQNTFQLLCQKYTAVTENKLRSIKYYIVLHFLWCIWWIDHGYILILGDHGPIK